MRLSERQHLFLAELDIPVWQWRAKSTASDIEHDYEPAEQASPALDIDLSPAIWLILASTYMNESEARLFDAMLKARKLTRNAVAVIDYQTFETLASDDAANKTLLVMGQSSVAPAALNAARPELIQHNESHWIASYSLQDMLHQPAFKATVWQALKLLPIAN